MGSAARGTAHSPQTAFRCPECGERVDTVMRRHKTLGAFVPLWGPGPCHNAACPAYTGPADGEGADGAPGPTVAGTA
ncbi:hypothetical protein ACIQ9E_04860 [Streptomyces sp. NPDC094448]|uniref:hypothetical protein n=1 Tax=Streptomyces sp. NPDC094448 TaxID=3366063 RepID=UPI00380C71C7